MPPTPTFITIARVRDLYIIHIVYFVDKYKMKNKRNANKSGTVPNYNRKKIERGKIDTRPVTLLA